MKRWVAPLALVGLLGLADQAAGDSRVLMTPPPATAMAPVSPPAAAPATLLAPAYPAAIAPAPTAVMPPAPRAVITPAPMMPMAPASTTAAPPRLGFPMLPAVLPVWHLPGSAARMRIAGEAGTLNWPIYIPSAATGIKAFQIGYQASIEVMPEASWITLTINGQTITRIPIASPGGVKIIPVAIPPGLLQAGWNAVSIEITQRHRVECSVASTYELWTQLDPLRTGFVGTPPAIGSIADLPALTSDENGATRFHLLLPRDPSPTDLGRAVRAVERVAIRGRFAHPVVDTTPGPSGLHIAVGTPALLATFPGMAGKVAPGPTRISTTADGAPLLIISGSTDDELDRAVDSLTDVGMEVIGSEEGLKAAARTNGLRLRPGGALTLAELGIPSHAFSGRLYRESFDVILPPDAYPADYNEARLSLDGGYAGGLARDSRLVVRVNGVIDGNLDFNRSGGAVLQGQVIHMPLDAFRPGRNRIELEGQLTTKADDNCDTLNSIGAKERFLLLGTSTLSLPPLARIAQFPGLSAALAGNLRITPSIPSRVFIPRATDGSVSAAATLLVNAALSTGVPTGAVFSRGTPQAGQEPAIVVGSPADMPGQVLDAVGLDGPAVAVVWRSGVRTPPGAAKVDGPRVERLSSDMARLDAWGDRVEETRGWLGTSDSWIAPLENKVLGSLRSAGLVGYPDQAVEVNADTNFVFAQGLLDDTPITLITARDDKLLYAGMATLTEPGRLDSLDGRAATLDDGATGINIVPARDTSFYRTQAFSFLNDRLVAAGWVSKHAGWYIAAVLIGAAALGFSTFSMLHSGRREPKA